MSNENNTPVNRELTKSDLSNLIQQVEGVINVKVNVDEQGFIQEIYVLADKIRGAKQIVRDIETAAAVEFNVELDHRKISVVQLDDHGDDLISNEDKRLVLQNLAMEYNGPKCKISVELNGTGKTCRAQTEGPGSEKNQARLVAQAVLAALEGDDDFNQLFSLVLEEVSIMNFASHRIALVGVSLVQASTEEFLVGSSVVRKDEKEAVARATLDAVNRKLNYLS